MKKVLLPSILLLIVLFFPSSAFAQSIGITSIGGVPTTGNITTWTHQGFNPLLVGVATPSAVVRIDIGSATASTAAASTGAWQYKPTDLDALGSYSVSVSSGGQSMLFTLGITATASATPTPASTASAQLPTELPKTGSDDIVLLFVGGAFLILTGSYTGAYLMGFFREE